ncbi:hypothetical protein [Ochrovirga pacifica]|uniref:hypothetical protein n=1 Tax=Ochrovirga pacifica TaxID=1042376 RepID=UPI000255A4DB|nr:hypothetical protein [Ochrovirga pacifica]
MKRILLLSFLLAIVCTNISKAYTIHPEEKPFLFIEDAIEFAVFKDGTFDFNLINSPNKSAHFNSDRLKNHFYSNSMRKTHVLKNRYGAIVQINRIKIIYDRLGRVTRIGTIPLFYNSLGWVGTIGHLNVFYHSNGSIYKCVGNIRVLNRYNQRTKGRKHLSKFYQPKYIGSKKFIAKKKKQKTGKIKRLHQEKLHIKKGKITTPTEDKKRAQN